MIFKGSRKRIHEFMKSRRARRKTDQVGTGHQKIKRIPKPPGRQTMIRASAPGNLHRNFSLLPANFHSVPHDHDLPTHLL